MKRKPYFILVIANYCHFLAIFCRNFHHNHGLWWPRALPKAKHRCRAQRTATWQPAPGRLTILKNKGNLLWLWADTPCGEYSSAGRAPDCGSGRRGFDPRYSPHHPLAPVAQLDRASASGAEGREFDSRRAHHTSPFRHPEEECSCRHWAALVGEWNKS